MWIFYSVLIISGAASLFWFAYINIQQKRLKDTLYTITKVVQTSQVKEALPTVYLAECMNLSSNMPTNIDTFDTADSQQQLLQSPAISSATVKRIFPDTIHVDYTTYEPIAYIADFYNAAIDAHKILFPIKPFFSPKRLPEIYLNIDALTLSWNDAINHDALDLAINLLQYLSPLQHLFNIQTIDVSNAYANSCGRREIIITLNNPASTHILRLNSQHYQQALSNYLALRNNLPDSSPSLVIDLRLPQLAYLSPLP